MKRILVFLGICLFAITDSKGQSGDCVKSLTGKMSFTPGISKLSSDALSTLNNLAKGMRANPNCKVVVMGNGNGNKVEQQRSWDRVNTVINFMVEKQKIDRDRFIFLYGLNGKANSVDYSGAEENEEGPSSKLHHFLTQENS